MDNEEHNHIQELIDKGRSVNDEGPFYHHTFWESYKGGVKGKFGGLVIGGALGAAVGAVAFGLLSILGLAGSIGGSLAFIGAIAGTGMLYGAHEFGDVGRITGAVASGLKVEERRMHEFELGKFTELKQELDDIKTLVGGKVDKNAPTTNDPIADKPIDAPQTQPQEKLSPLEEVQEKLSDYRTTHFNDTPLKKDGGLIFWKVALVGIVVGAAIGIFLAYGATGAAASELAVETFTKFGLMPIIEKASQIGIAKTIAASAITFGTVGASFGISRDLFRKIFDVTDPAFKGYTADIAKAAPQKLNPSLQQETSINASSQRPEVSTLVYQTNEKEEDNNAPSVKSATYFRDMHPAKGDKSFAEQAQAALAALDHTQSIRH